MTGPTAIVAEDEETLRHQLVEQLGQLWPELSIVGEAADGVQALGCSTSIVPMCCFSTFRCQALRDSKLRVRQAVAVTWCLSPRMTSMPSPRLIRAQLTMS